MNYPRRYRHLGCGIWEASRKLGVPIHQLLGGKVRQGPEVYAWIGSDRPSDVAERLVRKDLPKGFRAMQK